MSSVEIRSASSVEDLRVVTRWGLGTRPRADGEGQRRSRHVEQVAVGELTPPHERVLDQLCGDVLAKALPKQGQEDGYVGVGIAGYGSPIWWTSCARPHVRSVIFGALGSGTVKNSAFGAFGAVVLDVPLGETRGARLAAGRERTPEVDRGVQHRPRVDEVVLAEAVDDDADDAVEGGPVGDAVLEAFTDEQDVGHTLATVGVATHQGHVDAVVPRLDDVHRRGVRHRGAPARRLERHGDLRVPAGLRVDHPRIRPPGRPSSGLLDQVTRSVHASTVVWLMSATTPSSNSANRAKRGLTLPS